MSKTATWLINGKKITVESNSGYYGEIKKYINRLGFDYVVCDYAPEQVVNEESDFTILFADGTVVKAELHKSIVEYFNSLESYKFELHATNNYYIFTFKNNGNTIAYIGRNLPYEKQVKLLNGLIELYSDI